MLCSWVFFYDVARWRASVQAEDRSIIPSAWCLHGRNISLLLTIRSCKHRIRLTGISNQKRLNCNFWLLRGFKYHTFNRVMACVLVSQFYQSDCVSHRRAAPWKIMRRWRSLVTNGSGNFAFGKLDYSQIHIMTRASDCDKRHFFHSVGCTTTCVYAATLTEKESLASRTVYCLLDHITSLAGQSVRNYVKIDIRLQRKKRSSEASAVCGICAFSLDEFCRPPYRSASLS